MANKFKVIASDGKRSKVLRYFATKAKANNFIDLETEYGTNPTYDGVSMCVVKHTPRR